MNTNVIHLRPPWVINKHTYAPAIIWKETTVNKNIFTKLKGVQKIICLILNHHYSILSATVTTNVICLRPQLVVTKDTYAQAIIWKETTEEKNI